MPDDELLAAAASDSLSSPDELEAHARRMLEDPRGRAAMVDFHRQWLGFENMYDPRNLEKDPERYPGWAAAIPAVREEADRFVEYAMYEGGGTIEALLTSRVSFVNGPLAQIYGIESSNDWTEVELPAAERAGFLTRANFLGGFSHKLDSAPILRGVYVIARLLCGATGEAAEGADTSVPTAPDDGTPRTNRMLYEERTSPPDCQSCHTRINAVGFTLENYDATGAFREVDNTLPVDASGELLGTDVDGPFSGGVELSERLGRSKVVESCVAETWTKYALGRPVAKQDESLISAGAAALDRSGGNIHELLVAIVRSPAFVEGIR